MQALFDSARYLGVPKLVHVVELRQAGHNMFTVVARVRLIGHLLRVQDPVAGDVTRPTARQARGARRTVVGNRGGTTTPPRKNQNVQHARVTQAGGLHANRGMPHGQGGQTLALSDRAQGDGTVQGTSRLTSYRGVS